MLTRAKDTPLNLSDYLKVKEAAAFLGVSASTLRNWDRSGKLKARKHPVNNYRLYKKVELEELLRGVNRSQKK